MGVDAGSLRFVSRKAETAFQVQCQQFFDFLLALGLCPVLDTSHQKPLASPSASAHDPRVGAPALTHSRHTQTDRLTLTHTDRHTQTHTHTVTDSHTQTDRLTHTHTHRLIHTD